MADSANTSRRTFMKAVPFAALAAAGTTIPTADERIAKAMETLKAALVEKYPDFEVRATGGVQRSFNMDTDVENVVGHHFEIHSFHREYDPALNTHIPATDV